MNLYDEAMQSIDNDHQSADREREYRRREDQYEPLLKKLMGSDFEKFFEVTEEINKNHAQDCAI